MKASVKLIEGMKFKCLNDRNETSFETSPEGPTPKHLYLQGVCGCTAMDVISILEKMKQTDLKSFEVSLDAGITHEHPKVFEHFKMVYHVEGDIDPKKLKRAVELSQDTYCGVSHMAKMVSDLTYEIELNGEII